jgi:hypothetical protein
MTLLELAERCEREGPSRELMHLVQAHARDWAPSSPLILTSLDAAVAFVERVCPRARHGYEQQPDRSFFATIKPRHDGPITRRHEHGQAATPALALVAAALRALAARDGA